MECFPCLFGEVSALNNVRAALEKDWLLVDSPMTGHIDVSYKSQLSLLVLQISIPTFWNEDVVLGRVFWTIRQLKSSVWVLSYQSSISSLYVPSHM